MNNKIQAKINGKKSKYYTPGTLKKYLQQGKKVELTKNGLKKSIKTGFINYFETKQQQQKESKIIIDKEEAEAVLKKLRKGGFFVPIEKINNQDLNEIERLKRFGLSEGEAIKLLGKKLTGKVPLKIITTDVLFNNSNIFLDTLYIEKPKIKIIGFRGEIYETNNKKKAQKLINEIDGILWQAVNVLKEELPSEQLINIGVKQTVGRSIIDNKIYFVNIDYSNILVNNDNELTENLTDELTTILVQNNYNKNWFNNFLL